MAITTYSGLSGRLNDRVWHMTVAITITIVITTCCYNYITRTDPTGKAQSFSGPPFPHLCNSYKELLCRWNKCKNARQVHEISKHRQDGSYRRNHSSGRHQRTWIPCWALWTHPTSHRAVRQTQILSEELILKWEGPSVQSSRSSERSHERGVRWVAALFLPRLLAPRSGPGGAAVSTRGLPS